MLCADDLDLMSESSEGFKGEFRKWKVTFESKAWEMCNDGQCRHNERCVAYERGLPLGDLQFGGDGYLSSACTMW